MKTLDPNRLGRVLLTAVLAFMVCGYGTRAAGEALFREDTPPSGTIALEIAAGAVTGTIAAAPLDRVMARICERGAFRCKLIKPLSDYTISRRFEKKPLTEAIRSLLEAFDYVLIADSEGNIEELSVAWPKNEQPHQISFDQLALEAARKGLPWSPEAQPLPPFTPVINETGPVGIEGNVSSELPEFIPVMNDTGPPADSSSATTPLPPFLPVLPAEGASRGTEQMPWSHGRN